MKVRWVNLAELAAETGLAPRSLQYIRAREPGVLVTRQKGKVVEYKQPDCAVNLRNREAKAVTKESAALDDFKRRRLEADTRLAELELAKQEGQLIPLTDYETRLAAICDRIRAVLMTIPSKYLGRIQVTRTDVEAQSVGEQIRDELLTALQGTGDELDDDLMPAEPEDVEEEKDTPEAA
jgi:phage terminase Nu1 subunit (DNA packaging protein)